MVKGSFALTDFRFHKVGVLYEFVGIAADDTAPVLRGDFRAETSDVMGWLTRGMKVLVTDYTYGKIVFVRMVTPFGIGYMWAEESVSPRVLPRFRPV